MVELTQDQREEYEERAAILEFNGHMPRPDAEAEAMRLTRAKYGYTQKEQKNGFNLKQ